MLSSKTLKEIVSEARPIIERQLDDAEMIAGLRDVVAGAGGDWSALKALIKAQIQDERDETGNGKRVKKILDKAGFSTDYAELLGWSNMNEKIFSAGEEFDPITGEFLDKPVNAKLVATVATGMQTEIGRKALIAAVDIMIAREEAEEQNAPRPSENDKPCSKAVPQDKPSPAGIGSELLAGREGRHEGEAASVDLPTNSEIDPTEDRKEDHSLDGNAGANTGGRHVTAQPHRAATAGALVQVAPATNGIVFEACPPKPMKSLSYAHCFPDLSKTEYQCLAGDIALNGVLEPIVRMGDVIVDGWNRYNAARSLGIEYPVTSYRGDDVLLDVIRWQRSSRDWTPQQEHKIATALAKVVPHRSDDIWAAFHLAPTSSEVVAA